MGNKASPQLRIGICGSASVGKTSLVNALALDLDLPRLDEEMRGYLESTGVNLTELPASQVTEILVQLWKDRAQKESLISSFIADNCALDFAAYALYYECLNAENAHIFLSETLPFIQKYDAIFVLPWGVLPYALDGIRAVNQHLQLQYQFILEGLLRRYIEPHRLHFLPENITNLDDRRKWVLSSIAKLQPLDRQPNYLTSANEVVSHVVDMRAKATRFNKKNLDGSRVLVARVRTGISAIATQLRTLGAEVLETPSVSAIPLDDYSELDETLRKLSHFDALVFGCADGVRFTAQRFTELGMGFDSLRAIAIGDHTRQALTEIWISPLLTISGSCRDALRENFVACANKQLLLVTSREGRPNLHQELLQLSSTVETIAAYQTFHYFEPLQKAQDSIDLVILPSSSAANLLLTHEAASALKNLPMIAMGPATEMAARLCGASQIIRAPHDDIDSIVSCVLNFASKKASAEELLEKDYQGMTSLAR